jgi:DNA modification methylase
VAAGRKKHDAGKIAARFTKHPGNMGDLWTFYSESLMEFYRVLRPGGILIFKCQDIVAGGKNYFSHIFIANAAETIGFVLKDLFVLTTNRRLGQWNLKRQVHARKYHCYFMVFKR